MPLAAADIWSFKKLTPCQYPELQRELRVALSTGTYVAGEVLGELTASPGTYAQYNASNSDGTQVAKALCVYPCTVDGSGNITLSGEFGTTVPSAPVALGGYYRLEELVGLDSAGLTNLGGSLKQGSLGVDEVYHLTVDATSGNFRLSIDGGNTYTANIAFDAIASAVQSALNTLLGAGSVSVTLATGVYTITFLTTGAYAQEPITLTADSTGLSGNTHTATVTEVTAGVRAAGIMAF